MGNLVSGTLSADIKNQIKIYGYVPKQVDRIREEFILMCDDDLGIDLDKFKKLITFKDNEAKNIFQLFDIDNSGRIDSYEFICGLAILSHATLEEKAETIFKLYDFDNSLLLSHDELVVLFRCVICALNALSDRKNVPTIQEVEDLVKLIIINHDSDGNYEISLQEFKSIITSDTQIQKCLKTFGLIKSEDYRKDFGSGADGVPECDSDLEIEINKQSDNQRTEEFELIKDGIEFRGGRDTRGVFREDMPLAIGEKILAEKIWYKEETQSLPSIKELNDNQGNQPNCYLELERVHGYRCHDTRNNIHYTNDGFIVYHSANIGIVYDKKTNAQKFFLEHNDDISCMSVFETQIATGQLGENPSIHIWEHKTQTLKHTLKGVLKKGISHLCFSNNGKKLAASSMDENQTVMIYDLQVLSNSKTFNKLEGSVCIGNGPREKILDMKFDSSDNTLIFACVQSIYFGTYRYGNLNLIKGTGWNKKTPVQSLLCIAFIESNIVTGSYRGDLQVWKGGVLSDPIEAHKSALNSIVVKRDGKGFITGGNDGLVKIWDNSFKVIETIDLKDPKLQCDLMDYKVRALSEDYGNSLIIGTRGGEILEYAQKKMTYLVRSHFRNEVNGLAVNPKKDEYVTFGKDGLYMIWDTVDKKLIKVKNINFAGSCITYSNDGKNIALGCENGYVTIIETNNYVTIKTLKDRTDAISCIKFSPDDKYLAVGGADTDLIVYDVQKGFKFESKMVSHNTTVTKLDFSVDSVFIQSVDTNGRLLYNKTTEKKIFPKGKMSKDVVWSTWSLPAGMPVKGIWSGCYNEGDIKSIDIMNYSNENRIAAIGDNYGNIKLFDFPSFKPNASYNRFVGHSSCVSNVKFNAKGDHLFSIGSKDKTILQWKVINEGPTDNFEYQDEIDKDNEQKYKELDELQQEDPEKMNYRVEDYDLRIEDENTGKSFLEEIKKANPDEYRGFQKSRGNAPENNLSIKHVFGFRCYDTKNSVKYTSNQNKVLFISSGLGVVMDMSSKKQSFFFQHKNEVVSIALHPKQNICATGEMINPKNNLCNSEIYGTKNNMVSIYVWDVENKNVISHLRGFHLNAVSHLLFSPDGTKLLSLGKDPDHSCAIYDWLNERIITTTKIDRYQVTDVCFKDNNEFLTIGTKHIKWWTLHGSNLTCKRGKWSAEKAEPLVSVTIAFTQKICCTGSINGKLLVWSGHSCAKNRIDAHDNKPVRVLYNLNNTLYSGGDDGKIKTWTYNNKINQNVHVFCLKTAFPAGIRSLDIKNDRSLLLGTSGGEIHEVAPDKEDSTNIIMQGHYTGELHGLAVNADTTKFATCGGDKTVRKWDAHTNQMLKYQFLDEEARAIDWDHGGNNLVVADKNGTIYIFDINLQILSRQTVKADDKDLYVTDIKIDSESQYIAVGGHLTSKIEILSLIGTKLRKMSFIDAGITKPVTHLDFSCESGFLVINSGNNELKYCSVNNTKCIISMNAKEIKWYTWTCTLGPCVQGIYPITEGKYVNSCDRYKKQKNVPLQVTSDDFGCVNLFKFPAIAPKSGHKSYKGHCSPVSKVRFLNDGKYCVSIGKFDKSIILWESDLKSKNLDYAKDTLINEDNDDLNQTKNDEEIQLTEEEQLDVISVKPYCEESQKQALNVYEEG